MQTLTITLDDTVYHNLVSQIGKENLNDFVAQVLTPYSLFAKQKTPAYHRLGGSPPFSIPEDFDDIEITGFDE